MEPTNTSASQGSVASVLVLGSLRWTRALVPRADGETYVKHEGWVGAPIIREMIVEALIDTPARPKIAGADLPSGDDARRALERSIQPGSPSEERAKALRPKLGDITAVFKRFPRHSDPKKPEKVLRLSTNYVESLVDGSRSVDALRSHLTATLTSVGADPDILAVYDDDGSILKVLTAAESPLDSAKVNTRYLIVACRRDAPAESITKLAARVGCTPDTTVTIVTASWLRRDGANIVAYGSLEQTLKDIVDCTQSAGGSLRALLACSHHVVIVFEESGLAYLYRTANGLQGSFHFCPNFDDVAQFDARVYGRSPGHTALVLAAVVRQVASERSIGDLAPSLRLATAAATLHFDVGFDERHPFETAKSVLSLERRETLRACSDPHTTKERAYLVSSLAFDSDRSAASSWTRLGAWRGVRTDAEVRKSLRQLVRRGPEAVFTTDLVSDTGTRLWHPPAPISCPFLKIGALKIFDAEEIQGYLALGKQIRAYLDKSNQTKPLSIAVFGSPGSGKSTAVKQLLESVRPGSSKNMLVYNLSQFDSLSVLTEAFHQIQDRALELADAPLVMFDEFDCKFGETELGWLRYFLAPMQDGEFLGQSGKYKIGRAIFMFAGGTSFNFDDFQKKAQDETTRSAKLTDFVSRLLGFLNIRDINPPVDGKDSESQRLQRQVKRALTLEFQLRDHHKDIIEGSSGPLRISDDMIDAFLDALKYEHGIRSMEAIVKMSRPVSGMFVPASLPATQLLDMHARGFWNEGSSVRPV